ncbi:MAG: 50S ribosomal protein L5, partial [Candidatus Pacebacteria bacterium]|nr:50S ribosomal protein L5 [Candidatus Paceibacterota bacterium]
MATTSYLKSYYHDEVLPRLMKEHGYTNLLQVPRPSKVVVNNGVGSAQDREVLQEAQDTLALITGQRPVITKARRSTSNFKLRAGMSVGLCVTLRRQNMYKFVHRLVNV